MDTFTLSVLLLEELIYNLKMFHPFLVIVVEPDNLDSLWHFSFLKVILSLQNQSFWVYFQLFANDLQITSNFLLSLRIRENKCGNLRWQHVGRGLSS